MTRITKRFYMENKAFNKALYNQIGFKADDFMVNVLDDDRILIDGYDVKVIFCEVKEGERFFFSAVNKQSGIKKEAIVSIQTDIGLELNKIYLSV